MKKIRRNVSLNQRLAGISLAVFIPMILVMTYLLASLTNATSAYAQITKSVSYANMYARDFKERMDYSMYLAVIGKRDMEELGDGETTVNGILTVNPYILTSLKKPVISYLTWQPWTATEIRSND